MYQTPGVYKKDIFARPRAAFLTGVPVFLGLAERAPAQPVQKLTLWPQFAEQFGTTAGYLGVAVHAFFLNGGDVCYAVRLPDTSVEALRTGLQLVAPIDDIDLVCAPDIMWSGVPGAAPDPATVKSLQSEVLDYCVKQGDRLAILDGMPGSDIEVVRRQRRDLAGANGALYFPWVKVDDSATGVGGFVPPCGHVAGVFARTDRATGVHKAPANQEVEGVVDLAAHVSNTDQERLNPEGINCIRSFPGRGIRVWGARTLSGETAWAYVNVRRIFLTATRWIEANLTGTGFEPNDPQLWTRIGRELFVYFNGLFEQGALKGDSPQEAFYIKCDAETNPPEVREQGRVVTEIGLAPNLPSEFVVVRIIHGASGVTIAGPSMPGT
jgi:hypothetical protein